VGRLNAVPASSFFFPPHQSLLNIPFSQGAIILPAVHSRSSLFSQPPFPSPHHAAPHVLHLRRHGVPVRAVDGIDSPRSNAPSDPWKSFFPLVLVPVEWQLLRQHFTELSATATDLSSATLPQTPGKLIPIRVPPFSSLITSTKSEVLYIVHCFCIHADEI